MDNHTYQLIINTFSVGTWLQTLGFYFVLFFMAHVILTQLKQMPSELPIEFSTQNEEETA